MEYVELSAYSIIVVLCPFSVLNVFYLILFHPFLFNFISYFFVLKYKWILIYVTVMQVS